MTSVIHLLFAVPSRRPFDLLAVKAANLKPVLGDILGVAKTIWISPHV